MHGWIIAYHMKKMGALIYALISVEHVSEQGHNPVKTENKSYFKLIIQI